MLVALVATAPRRSFDPFGFRLGGRLRPARDRLTADHAILPGRWATVGGSRAPIVTAMGSLIDVSTWAAGAASTGAATASARDRREAAPHAAGDAARTPSARPGRRLAPRRRSSPRGRSPRSPHDRLRALSGVVQRDA